MEDSGQDNKKDKLETFKTSSSSSSFLTRTKTFQALTKWAWDCMDSNKSGTINKSELYSGLLLIHIQLAKYAGPAACRPPSLEKVEKVFELLDEDDSGCIEYKEFAQLMVILCGQIMTRVVVQYAMIFLLFPYVAKWLFAWSDSAWGITSLIERLYDSFAPDTMRYVVEAYLPATIWDGVPASAISSVLFFLALPFVLDTLDDWFHGVAVRTSDKKEE